MRNGSIAYPFELFEHFIALFAFGFAVEEDGQIDGPTQESLEHAFVDLLDGIAHLHILGSGQPLENFFLVEQVSIELDVLSPPEEDESGRRPNAILLGDQIVGQFDESHVIVAAVVVDPFHVFNDLIALVVVRFVEENRQILLFGNHSEQNVSVYVLNRVLVLLFDQPLEHFLLFEQISLVDGRHLVLEVDQSRQLTNTELFSVFIVFGLHLQFNCLLVEYLR